MVPPPLLDLDSVPVQIIVFFFNIGDPLTRYVNAIESVSVKTFIYINSCLIFNWGDGIAVTAFRRDGAGVGWVGGMGTL